MNNKKESTRQKIKDGLVELLRNHFLDELSISMVCQHAGVSRVGFYNNYSNIDEVVIDMIQTGFEEVFMDKFSNESYVFSNEYVMDVITYFDKNTELTMALSNVDFGHYLQKLATKKMLNHFESYKDNIVKNYYDYFKSFHLSNMYHVCLCWIHKGKPESCQELYEIILHFRQLENNLAFQEILP